MTKITSGVAGLVISAALAASPVAAATKVFLLGGQSNMAGRGQANELTTPYNVAQTSVKLWSNRTGNAWVDLQGGFGAESPDFGPEVSFGYAVKRLFPADEIYLIKYGIPATNLAFNWKPSGTGTVSTAEGYYYNVFQDTTNAAINNLIAAGKSPSIAGMLWMQGESDALNTSMANAYEANLRNLIGAVRSDFATPTMPFIVGRITTLWGTAANNAKVRTAEDAVGADPTLVNVSTVSTDSLSLWVSPHAYPNHYDTQGQIELGTLFANQFAPTPEPSTCVLAGTGFLVLVGYLRRR